MGPFNNLFGMLNGTPPSRTDNGSSSGIIGGVAPSGNTVGVRRDFTSVPQFLPNMTIAGGLKQPPRG